MTDKPLTLEQTKDQVAKEMMFDNFKQAGLDRSSIDEIAKRYARECCKATLEKAAENAKVDSSLFDADPKLTSDWINKSSITDPSNITLV